MWVPFNEGWGQHDTPRYVDWIKKHDPTRGWSTTPAAGPTRGTGDVADMHNYPGPGMPPTEKARAAVLGEFGGLGLPAQGPSLGRQEQLGLPRRSRQAGTLTRAYLELIMPASTAWQRWA